jgi:aminopeptidase N
MYDEMNDKMITETITTFDSTYAVLSNGTRYKVTSNSDGTKTWYYTMTKPHASYLLMLAIGNYAITDRRSASGVPLRLYSYPEHPERIEPTYRMSVESMDFLEREIGIPYPWESYSQVPVADYIFGAMENTTATIFGDFLHTDERGWLDRSYVGTNVHELTHQWFGDYITGRSGKSIWLQESFATFYPHLFTRETVGEDAYQWSRRGMHRSAHAAAEKDRLPIVHPSSGSARIYPKGASVIDMMRYAFGEQSVRRVIQHYLRKHPYTTVETNDLYLAFQDTLGLSPKWFFDQWLYQGGEPHYRVSTRLGAVPSEKGIGTTTLVDIEQIHQIDELTGVFSMPVVLEVHYTDRTKDSVRVMVNQQRMLVEVPNPNNKVPAFVLFDPGSYILKRVTFDRSWDARMAQLQNAPLMIDRYDALETFRGDTSRSAERRAMIAGVLTRETFHALRSEAAQQAIELAQKGIPEAWELVKRGLTDKALEVRSATLGALPTIPQQLRETVVGMLRDTSYAVIQSALTKLATSFPSDKSILAAVKGVRGPHERVRITRLEIEATWNDDAGAVKDLADLCGPGWEFITRQNAMQALRRVGTVTPLAAENMLLAVLSTNTRLAGVAQSVLNGLCEQPRLKSIVSTVAKTMQLNEIQRDTLAQYLR